MNEIFCRNLHGSRFTRYDATRDKLTRLLTRRQKTFQVIKVYIPTSTWVTHSVDFVYRVERVGDKFKTYRIRFTLHNK
jgi:hypothetical protein